MKVTGMGIFTALALAFFPFFTIGNVIYGDTSSKVLYLGVLTSALLIYVSYRFFRGKLPLSLKGRWLIGALALVVLVQYAASFLGVFPERSLYSDIFWSTGTLFLTNLALLAVLFGELLSKVDWSVVRKWMTVSGGFFGLLTIFGTDGLDAFGRFLWINMEEGSLTIGNETYAGAYLVLVFIFGLIEYLRSEKQSVWRKTLLVSLVLMFLSPLLFAFGLFAGKVSVMEILSSPSLLLGGARSSSAALFALLGYLGGYALLKRFVGGSMQKPALLLWTAGVLGALFVGISLLFTPNSVVQNAYIEASSAARIIVWDVSMQALEDKPLLGWGPENFNYAFTKHFDNRLFEERNLGEIWFERAHNVFLDTLATVGVVGMVAWTLLVGVYLLVLYRARKKEEIGEMESVLLFGVVPVHVLQMQTGFDTVASYTMLALFLAYALSLEKRIVDTKALPPFVYKTLAVVCVLLALLILKTSIEELGRNAAVAQTFIARSAAAQKEAIAVSLTRPSAFEALRISYASFVSGSLASIAEAPSEAKVKLTLEFMQIYASYFETYIAAQPDNYRAHINYAYLLLLQTALGSDHLEKAKEHIAIAYTLSDKHPLTLIMDSAAHLYGGDLQEADRLMQEAVAINPDIEFTRQAASWLAKQKQTFPSVSVLRITNL